VGLGSKNYRNTIKYTVKDVIIHPWYDSRSYNNDIGLIKLNESIRFSIRVSKISLPFQNEPVPPTLGVVSGWGYTSENGRISPILMEAHIPVIENISKCRTLFKKYNVIITNSMVCAGIVDGSKDSCQGDSGGPFVVNNKQVGIVSWGIGCARKNLVGVYTKVSKYVNWINRYL